MKSYNQRRVSTHKINTVFVIAVLCIIVSITTSCRDEFYYGNKDAKKTFAIPNQSELELVEIGDSVTGFLYSDFQSKHYKVYNKGKDFQINIVDYKNTYDDKYCSTTVMTTYSDQSTYGTTITRNGNAYKISSSSEYTHLLVEATGSYTSGYYAFKFAEITCDEIIINDPAKTFYYDNYNSSYQKKIQINGVANKNYRFTFSTSSYSASSSIVNSSGYSILSGSGNFTFPSDGKPCYIIVTSYYDDSFTAKIVELTDGKSDAISIYSSRNTSYVNATTYHSNDSYPSQWYKFYGTAGKVYVIQSNDLFYYYSIGITSPTGSTVSKIGQKFTMPNEDFVYIKMSYTYGSTYYSSNNFYVYPETSVQSNAILLGLNQTNTIYISDNDYLAYDEVYGSSLGKYVRWYKFAAVAGKKYTFTFDYYSSNYSNISIYSGLTPAASINYNDVVSYANSSTQTLYLKIESYYSNTISFTSKEE